MVRGEDWRKLARDPMRIRQAYIIGGATASVRVRVGSDRAWLNLKSATIGVSRAEFDFEISATDGEQVIESLCACPLIEKTRFFVDHAGHCWEVDVFEGDNSGLIVAEIELNSEDELFELPPWTGEEVSLDSRYYNAALVERPFSSW